MVNLLMPPGPFTAAMSTPAPSPASTPACHHRSAAERLRKPASYLIGTALAVLLIMGKAEGFESTFYKGIELTGFLLVFVAALGRVWCTLFIAGRKNRELCTIGPYGMCRNPLYLFSFAGLIGVCLAAQVVLIALVSAGLYLLYYAGVIRGEEARLRALFGPAYETYVAGTPRFWPRLLLPRTPHTVQVNSAVFARSLREIIWFLFALILVEIIETLKRNGTIPGWSLPF